MGQAVSGPQARGTRGSTGCWLGQRTTRGRGIAPEVRTRAPKAAPALVRKTSGSASTEGSFSILGSSRKNCGRRAGRQAPPDVGNAGARLSRRRCRQLSNSGQAAEKLQQLNGSVQLMQQMGQHWTRLAGCSKRCAANPPANGRQHSKSETPLPRRRSQRGCTGRQNSRGR